MARELTIDGVRITDDADCYVIAEIGHNHQGDLDKCKAMFLAAKEAGASAVKLQKRDNRALFTKSQYDYPYDNENSFGSTYGEHRAALEFGRDDYEELQKYAKKLKITFFATAFDEASVDFLADLGMPAIKVASGDLRSTHLLAYVAQMGVPIVLSTGAGSLDDVRRAVDTILPINPKLALLQCTAAYPPEYDELDLRVIETYRSEFPDTVIGYSGHDSGIAMGVLAYALGARVIEKHFTLNRAMKGTDHAFSLEPVGLRKLVRDVRRARVAFGSADKRIHSSERDPARKMGKKLVARGPMRAGTVLEDKDIAMKSPGDGLWPYQRSEVIGRRLTADLEADDAITFDVLAPSDA